MDVSTEMSKEKLRNEWILPQVEAATGMVKTQFVKKRKRSWEVSNKHSKIFLKLSLSLL